MKLASCALLAVVLATAACGPEFDPPNAVTTLRVLGVEKDKPYAQPGETVKLSLLSHDPKGRTLQKLWLGGCFDPPGDLYYGCFPQFAQRFQDGTLPAPGDGDSYELTLPSDVISSRRDLEEGQPRYGLSIVFFALCAGRIELDSKASQGAEGSAGLPIRCYDEHDKPLGSEDFVVGYSSIYSFEDASNENPAFSVDSDGVGEFSIAGKRVPADCVGAACQTTKDVEVDCDETPERCIKTCKDDGDSSCPAIDVKPAIEKHVEPDQVSSKLFGTTVTEQMWVNYYVDHGRISDVRLLNDTNSGWNDKYRGQLRAPKEAGPLQVWSVIHDNRGGMAFARVTLRAK